MVAESKASCLAFLTIASITLPLLCNLTFSWWRAPLYLPSNLNGWRPVSNSTQAGVKPGFSILVCLSETDVVFLHRYSPRCNSKSHSYLLRFHQHWISIKTHFSTLVAWKLDELGGMFGYGGGVFRVLASWILALTSIKNSFMVNLLSCQCWRYPYMWCVHEHQGCIHHKCLVSNLEGHLKSV